MCGAGLGFIVANVPGLMVGAFAGNRLGAVRDAKGTSVASVFASLGGEQKAQVCTFHVPGPHMLMSLAQILRALAAKILGSAL